MTVPQQFDFLKMARTVQTSMCAIRYAKDIRASERALLIAGLSDVEDLLMACQAKRDAAAKGLNGYKGAAR